jgi:hypothetical protein
MHSLLRLLGAGLVAAAPALAAAQPVWGTDIGDAFLSGSRSLVVGQSGVFNGTLVKSDYAAGAVSIDWTIAKTAVVGGFQQFRYSYVFSGPFAKNPSHFVLGLSASCLTSAAANAECASDVRWAVGNSATNLVSPERDAAGRGELDFGTYENTNNGANPGLPAAIGGFKVNTGDFGANDRLLVSFLSMRTPVWGDVYLKGGNGSYGYDYASTCPQRIGSGRNAITIQVPCTRTDPRAARQLRSQRRHRHPRDVDQRHGFRRHARQPPDPGDAADHRAGAGHGRAPRRRPGRARRRRPASPAGLRPAARRLGRPAEPHTRGTAPWHARHACGAPRGVSTTSRSGSDHPGRRHGAGRPS